MSDLEVTASDLVDMTRVAAAIIGRPTASWWNQNPGSPATGPITSVIF